MEVKGTLLPIDGFRIIGSRRDRGHIACDSGFQENR